MITFPDATVYELREETLPDDTPQLFRVKHYGEGVRPGVVKRPEIYWLSNQAVELTEGLQWLTYELFRHGAPSLPEDLAKTRHESLYHYQKAFANYIGYCAPSPLRKNYILRKYLNDNSAENPGLDKVRFCGGFTGLGVIERDKEYYDYLIEPPEARYVRGDVVWFEYIDPNNLPTINELIGKPWLYFHATIAYENRAGQFPNGQQPELDIWEPTLVPFISPVPVFWPLKYLEPVTEIADPYTFGG